MLFEKFTLNENYQSLLYEIYVLCFINKEREENMRRRFLEIKTHCNLCIFKENNTKYPDISGCFSNHLAMMEYFYHYTTKPYGIFMENDIYLKKSLSQDLENICKMIPQLKTDILLGGYLLDRHPIAYGCFLNKKIDEYEFYLYPPHLWGSQFMILTREHVQFFLQYFTPDYVLKGNPKEIISADWTLTKMGNRMLVYPPLGIEEGEISDTQNLSQINFHKNCKTFLYNNHYTN